MTPSTRDGRTTRNTPAEGEGGGVPGPTYDERMRGTILLVEDDYSMGTLVQDYLLHDEYRVVWVRNGAEALAEARRRPFSLVLLDVGLPDIDGFDVCRRLKTFCDVPVIMLTARGDEADRVAGLEIGADDYVPKPFSPRELMARVKAVLRRAGATDDADTLHAGDVDVDLRAREVTVAGAPVQLTQKEFDLLIQLVSHPGVVYSRDELLERAWRLDYPGGTRTVDVHVAQLRRKLGRAGHHRDGPRRRVQDAAAVASVLDRVWSRLWLAVFLATVIPLAVFVLFGALLIQRSVENADVRAIGRQARTLGAIIADETPSQRAAVQDAVASVGRQLSIMPLDALTGSLPDSVIAEVKTAGFAEGRLLAPEDVLYAAVRSGDEVLLLRRPYDTPVLDLRQWLGQVLIGGSCSPPRARSSSL